MKHKYDRMGFLMNQSAEP